MRNIALIALFSSLIAQAGDYGSCKQDEHGIFSIACMEEFINQNEITDLDDYPRHLPQEFLVNFILKHNNGEIGPRGHLHEQDQPGLGQGADAINPRAIVYGQNLDNGFTISYNGNYSQKNGHTLDMMEYSEEKGLMFWKADFTPGHQPNINENDCMTCHGPKEKMRPVFSMYPDWPGFYGSDNDEITNPSMNIPFVNYDATIEVDYDYQKNELKEYMRFRAEAQSNPRYAPLYNEEEVKRVLDYDFEQNIVMPTIERSRWSPDWSQVPIPLSPEYIDNPENYGIDWNTQRGGSVASYPWEYFFQLFPFRPGHSLISTRDLSRAFSHRPGLRFNIFISRMHNKNMLRIIKNHIAKEKSEKGDGFIDFRPFFLYNTMMCENGAQLDSWFRKASVKLNQTLTVGNGIIESHPLADDPNSNRFIVDRSKKIKLLEYDRKWKLVGLSLRDADMRLSYNDPSYDAYLNGTTEIPGKVKKGVMKLGYFDSAYFNSYNDGSTTTDELIAGTLLQELVKENDKLHEALARNTSEIRWSYVEKYYKKSGEFVNKSFSNNFYEPEKRKINLWGLVEKYGRFPGRYSLDREFFHKMDSHGKWINLPYDPTIGDDHHRTPWLKGDGRRTNHFFDIHKGVCDSLEEVLSED